MGRSQCCEQACYLPSLLRYAYPDDSLDLGISLRALSPPPAPASRTLSLPHNVGNAPDPAQTPAARGPPRLGSTCATVRGGIRSLW